MIKHKSLYLYRTISFTHQFSIVTSLKTGMYGIESGTLNETSSGSISLASAAVAVACLTAGSKSHDSQDK